MSAPPIQPRPTLTTVSEHLAGSSDSWHGTVSPSGPFKPEQDRYHLYIGLFCPFAHRANLVRHLRGLQEILPISIVRPYPKGDSAGWPGWQFNHPASGADYAGSTVDHLFGSRYLHEVYFRADPNYKGRYSVPVLWDKHTNTIVNNESADLLRFLPTCFDFLIPPDPTSPLTLYPAHLHDQITSISTWLQRSLNTGVYAAGFAETQAAYDSAVPAVFAALNAVEKLLSHSAASGPYVLGDALTELDIRLYATAVRFDAVYVQHFKCNLRTIRGGGESGYPHVERWLRNLYWNVPGFRETTDFRHIKENYTKSHGEVNPRAITPLGPWPDILGEPGEVDFREGLVVGECGHPEVLRFEREELEKEK